MCISNCYFLCFQSNFFGFDFFSKNNVIFNIQPSIRSRKALTIRAICKIRCKMSIFDIQTVFPKDDSPNSRTLVLGSHREPHWAFPVAGVPKMAVTGIRAKPLFWLVNKLNLFSSLSWESDSSTAWQLQLQSGR